MSARFLPCCQRVGLAVDEEEPLLVLAELEPLYEPLDGGRVVVFNPAGANNDDLVNVNKIRFDQSFDCLLNLLFSKFAVTEPWRELFQ